MVVTSATFSAYMPTQLAEARWLVVATRKSCGAGSSERGSTGTNCGISDECIDHEMLSNISNGADTHV